LRPSRAAFSAVKSAIRNAAGRSANSMKEWRRIAIRRYGYFAFVPHADYLIIGSNFCQALVANPNRPGRRTDFFAFPVGQSCCSALNSWAAQHAALP